jgi:acyl-CoA thioesterase
VGQTIQEALRIHETSPGSYAATITDDWWQGAGAYGGISAGLIVRAAQAFLGGESSRVPRALHVLFTAPPASGLISLKVNPIRQGARVSFLEVRVEQAEKAVAHGTVTLGKPRAGEASVRHEQMPKVPGVDKLAALPEVPQTPRYFEHLDIRPCLGSPPLGQTANAMFGGWVKLDEGAPVDHAYIAAIMDVGPPSYFVTQSEFRRAASVTASYHFLEARPEEHAESGDSLMLRIRSRVCNEGYSDEEQHLWSPSGRLLARANQVIAIG